MAKEDFDYVWTDKKRTIFGLPLSFTRYYLTETKLICRHGLLSIVLAADLWVRDNSRVQQGYGFARQGADQRQEPP